MLYKHIETEGIYLVYLKGKLKKDGVWVKCVHYRRLPVLLKPHEDINEIYTRTQEDFDEKFVEVTYEQLVNMPGVKRKHLNVIDSFRKKEQFLEWMFKN